MKIGIIAAMPQELKILVEALENGDAMRSFWLKVVSEKSCLL